MDNLYYYFFFVKRELFLYLHVFAKVDIVLQI